MSEEELELAKVVSTQQSAQIHILQDNASSMARGIQSTLYNVIPLWKNQISIELNNIKAKKRTSNTESEEYKANAENNAKEIGFNKVAFAHHADDAIETLFMNEIYGGRVATFAPKMHLEKADIEFIRPLINVRESDIKKFIE